MKETIENTSILLAKAQDFTRVATLENYEGMLGTLSEDDQKVNDILNYISVLEHKVLA